MDAWVVNLDRSADRLAGFASTNGQVQNVRRFPAIDGALVDRQALVSDGSFEPETLRRWRPGAIGCALSHFALWDLVIRSGHPALICEDDTVFHARLNPMSARLLDAVGSDWDIVLWGWSFCGPFAFDLPGVTTTHWISWADLSHARLQVDEFKHYATDAAIVRMRHAYGTFAYAISPAGAQKLRSFCRPLRKVRVKTAASAFTSTYFHDAGVDIMMNALYPDIRAFAALPPIVMHRGDVSSTIRAS